LDALQSRRDLQIDQLNFFVPEEQTQSLRERMKHMKVPFTVNSGGKALEIFKHEKLQSKYLSTFSALSKSVR